MAKAGIIYNDSKPIACQTVKTLEDRLASCGWEVALANGSGGILGYSHPGAPVCYTAIEDLVPPGFAADIDFAIVLGGDGTVLSACRQLAPCQIPMLTINTGHLGFLTETYVSQLADVLDQVLAKTYTVEERAMMTIQVTQGDAVLWEVLCLNEMLLHKEPLTGMCHFEVEVGQHALVDIAADGVIVCTPTGSTAYALSAGGPVIAPGVAALQLTPVCPHSLASRALVFADTEPVEVFSANHEQLVLVVDGNAGCYVAPEDRVKILKSPYTARFIRLSPPEFFKILQEKLGWGLPHGAKPNI